MAYLPAQQDPSQFLLSLGTSHVPITIPHTRYRQEKTQNVLLHSRVETEKYHTVETRIHIFGLPIETFNLVCLNKHVSKQFSERHHILVMYKM